MAKNNLPAHVAFIMDGNGRWAKAKGLNRNQGHEAGAKAVNTVIDYASQKGIKYITLYAFSTENWSRPKLEIKGLMDLLMKTLEDYETNSAKNNAKLIVSGRRSGLPSNVVKKIDDVIAKTAKNTGLVVNIALNYGARQEITDAVNKLIAQGKKAVTEADITAALYNPIPDPDLIIRTSGEYRLSNFLLWQGAYSELYFTDALWPDFDEKEFDKALESYADRDRRYGGI
ncbi:undecaprenyl diphosphate synthase [Elusimicrobium simillimum]|uniref:polyprenyl diphosphate synthase n=1 Tax=Elusimicrobium simillimum TaxID=3143438 RepID=UPI003C6FF543